MNEITDLSKKLEIPVLFIVFNRPDTTKKVFERIRIARPSRLYFAADGPREFVEGEKQRCEEVREIIKSVDWPCEVHTLIHKNNLGCKFAPTQALDWFFDNEECGIILEDDCVPSSDFFHFCQTLLHKYRNINEVYAICGTNFQSHINYDENTYYFSRYFQAWGWASWRRAWIKNDIEMSFWPKWRSDKAWKSFFDDKTAINHWEKTFDKVFNNEIKSAWDFSWLASIWFNKGLVVVPRANLISNIGFGVNATHTTNPNDELANRLTEKISEIKHPNIITPNIYSEKYDFENTYRGKYMRFPLKQIHTFYRVFRKIYRFFWEIF